MGISTVRIEVDGIAPVITDWLGYYRFYTVPGAARMRVSKAGYITKELTLDLADHRIENVALATVAPRVDLSGTYELTLEAPSQCRGLIPEPLLTRRYTAEIKQGGAVFRGIVSGARFVDDRNYFQGVVSPTTISLDFITDPYYPDYVFLAEIVDDANYLGVWGGALLTPNGRNFAGPFSGSFLIFPSQPPGAPPHTRCFGSSRLRLTR